jgi:cysteine desulfurase
MEAELAAQFPDIRFFGRNAPRLPNTSCFALPGLAADTALISLDLDGVSVSSGSACSSGKVGQSHVLAAMGVAETEAKAAIRVSLGWNSTVSDIEQFMAALSRAAARMKRKVA